ncbi:MAG: DUF6067 family protein, partial [Vicinamibacterales bacterium]|nr:DUF6067 family protein [Vicinamibacterales bacterium]
YKDGDRWRYVVLTWDRTIPETTVYADVHHVRPNTSKDLIATMKFGSVIEIGNHANNGDSAVCDKVIDEVRIWNRQLGPEEIAHNYRKRIRLHTDPRVRIRQTDRPIRIDGVLDETEWADAAVLGGLTAAEPVSLSPVRTRFLLTYDRKHLYVGMHSDLPADAKGAKANKLLYGMVKADVADHDGDVGQDDALRILVWEQKRSRLYRLLANSLGTTYDEVMTYGPGDDGGMRPTSHHPGWEPKWTTKSTVDMDGWHLEAAIPFADLEIEPAEGRELRVHIGRIWKRLRQANDHWAVGVLNDVTGSSAPVANLGTVVLAADEPVRVAIDRFDISPTDRETIEVVARIKNRSDGARKLSVTLQVDRKAADPQVIELAGGDEFEFASKVQRTEINDALHFSVIDTSDPAVVHLRQTVPVHRPHKLSIGTRHYLTERVMSVSWRMGQVSAPLAELRGSVRILGDAGRVLREQTDIRFQKLVSDTEISTRGIPSGVYRVETLVRHEDRVLALVHTAFDLKAAEDFPWYGNDIGFPTEPPPPWTAMTWDRDTDTVHCWGRETRYERKLLPTQIVNQDKPMLAAPMRLELTADDGQAIPFGQTDATVEWKQQNPLEMSAARSETSGPVAIRIQSVSEFDGFVWMDLTVSPRGDAPAAVSGLTLIAPLKAEWANLVNVSDYSMRKTGALPDDFKGNLGATWIGNGLGGIQFLSETTAPWGLKSPHRCLTVRRADGVATMRINLIDHPVELAEPRTFSFGFMVTPVKPRPEGYRRWILGPKDPAKAYNVLGRNGGIYLPLFVQGWSKLYKHDFDGHPLAEHYPDGPFPDEFRSVDVQTPGGTARKDVCLYVSANRVPADSEEHERWGDEWVIDATQPTLINAGYGPRLCPGAPSMVDWRVWGMAETMKVLGNRGYYFDVGFPEWCNNHRHGCGTVDRDGKRLPTWSILPHRRFLKRLYVALKAISPDSLITYHSSGTAYMPMYSFCDLLLDEDLQVSYWGGGIDPTTLADFVTHPLHMVGSD